MNNISEHLKTLHALTKKQEMAEKEAKNLDQRFQFLEDEIAMLVTTFITFIFNNHSFSPD